MRSTIHFPEAHQLGGISGYCSEISAVGKLTLPFHYTDPGIQIALPYSTFYADGIATSAVLHPKICGTRGNSNKHRANTAC
jgi:hypothetical protein